MQEEFENDNRNVLDHLAIIMDGNGRWAKERNLSRIFGHKVGLDNVKGVVEFLSTKNIKYLTMFAFSTENLFREKDEVDNLMALFDYALGEYRELLIKNNISFKVIGDLSILSDDVKKKVLNLENETSINCGMQLNIAFNYGGRADILNAVKNIAQKVLDNELNLSDLNEEVFEHSLYTEGIPSPDLLIRTGGHKRLSNFLLWQLSYSELFFCDDYWPDFNIIRLESILNDYLLRKRNFGRVSNL